MENVETVIEVKDTTSSSSLFFQNITSNNLNPPLLSLDILTVRPSFTVVFPWPSQENQKETEVTIEFPERNRARGFYYLMLNGEVECLPDNKFRVKKELLNILRLNSISFMRL